MTLTEEQKAELDRYYTNGAYVEATSMPMR